MRGKSTIRQAIGRFAGSRVAIALLLAAAVFLCFSPILRNGFVGYDDPDYVTRNPYVNGGLSWRMVTWAFTTAHASNWHPLTWISHGLDCSLFGLDPVGHHLTSLLLHAANTALLFLWLSGATGFRGRSAFVALAFGLHPLHVESVAWVAERKDVLCVFFLLLALLAYIQYVARPSTARYAWVAAAFLAALLSKPMAIPLPLLLLALDYWPLQRTDSWRRLIVEKLPLLALSALSAAATLWAQSAGGSVSALGALPLTPRIENAAVSYVAYLGRIFWPVNLAAFYPFPVHGIALWKIAGSSCALAAITWFAWYARRSRPWIAAGWIWYVLTLIPVIGLVQVGMQAMADRYMYVPMIGLLIPISWELARFRLAPAAAALALAACAVLSWRQIPVWKDGLTLWTHAVEVTRDNSIAHDNLGVELDALGRHDEALAQYREALRIQPDQNAETNFARANFAKGERLFSTGHPEEALAAFREGLRYRPANALAHSYAGAILTGEDHLAAAIAEFRMALAIDPKLSRAHMGLGVALARSGRTADAELALQQSVSDDPSSVEAHYDLGLIEAALGRRAEAIEAFEAALRLDPNDAPARAALDTLAGKRQQ